MPTLTFTNDQTAFAGLLTGRVLVGRRLSHGVVFSDPSVSRLHAWIDPVDDDGQFHWAITDAGSKTGTFVNERQVTRHVLREGDEIRVGAAKITFHDQNAVHPGITPVELSSPTGVVKTSGILFECSCGAPLWVGNELAGKRGLCRHCRKPVTVPKLPEKPEQTTAGREAPAPPKKRQAKCAVCHSNIGEAEEMTVCPDCAVTYHTDCWQENLGCSTYGCPQVNALVIKPASDPAAQIEFAFQGDSEAKMPPAQTPWDLILLAASVVGSLLGSLLFGSLAAVVALFSLILLIRGKQRRPSLLIAAVVISLLGIAAGLIVSDFWFYNARHLPAWIRT